MMLLSERTHEIVTHLCCQPDCTKWGGFGFDRMENRIRKTDWWCWEHYPFKKPPQSRSSGEQVPFDDAVAI